MGKAPDFLFLRYKNRIRKRFGLKTKKNRIVKKYFDRFMLEMVMASAQRRLDIPKGELIPFDLE